MPSVGIHAEFVVAVVEVLDECVPGTDHSCRAESCQAAHGPQSGRQEPVIGFDGVIAYCSVTWHAAGISSLITRR